jgi:1-phosphatidylinositol-5-phosphate 4-kinase
LCNIIINYCRKFDLKGSTVDREASDKEKEKDLPTLKDNDFVKEGMKIYIGDDAKEKLLETLTADVEVCCALALAIHQSVFCFTVGYKHITLIDHL